MVVIHSVSRDIQFVNGERCGRSISMAVRSPPSMTIWKNGWRKAAILTSSVLCFYCALLVPMVPAEATFIRYFFLSQSTVHNFQSSSPPLWFSRKDCSTVAWLLCRSVVHRLLFLWRMWGIGLADQCHGSLQNSTQSHKWPTGPSCLLYIVFHVFVADLWTWVSRLPDWRHSYLQNAGGGI